MRRCAEAAAGKPGCTGSHINMPCQQIASANPVHPFSPHPTPPPTPPFQACAAGGALRELRLRADSQLTVSPDALGPLCACLERLSLQAHSCSHESASTAIYAFGLEELTALRELELVGRWALHGCQQAGVATPRWAGGRQRIRSCGSLHRLVTPSAVPCPLHPCSAVELHRCHLPPGLTQLHLQGFRDLTSSMRHSLPRQASRTGRQQWDGRSQKVRGANDVSARSAWSRGPNPSPSPAAFRLQLEALSQLRALHLVGICECV